MSDPVSGDAASASVCAPADVNVATHEGLRAGDALLNGTPSLEADQAAEQLKEDPDGDWSAYHVDGAGWVLINKHEPLPDCVRAAVSADLVFTTPRLDNGSVTLPCFGKLGCEGLLTPTTADVMEIGFEYLLGTFNSCVDAARKIAGATKKWTVAVCYGLWDESGNVEGEDRFIGWGAANSVGAQVAAAPSQDAAMAGVNTWVAEYGTSTFYRGVQSESDWDVFAVEP